MKNDQFDGFMAALKDALSVNEPEPLGDAIPSRTPPTDPGSAETDIRGLRRKLGLSQQRFADAFGVSVGTVRNWEQGRRRPDGPARILLRVIDREPAAVLRALSDPSR